MSTIDDFLRDASPSQIAPLLTSHDKATQARVIVEWARGRHQDLAERVRACHRIAGSVTDGYHGGRAAEPRGSRGSGRPPDGRGHRPVRLIAADHRGVRCRDPVAGRLGRRGGEDAPYLHDLRA